MFRKAALGAGVLLTAFHLWLLVGQAWDGQLLEPGRLLRWIAAAGVVSALSAFRRQGVSILFSRQAATVWLLAVLLHGPTVIDRLESHGAPAVPEVAAALSQLALLSAVLGVGQLLARSRARARLAFLIQFLRIARPGAVLGALLPGVCSQFSPRPPPLSRT